MKSIFPGGATGTFFINNSNAYILIIGISFSPNSGGGFVQVQDPSGNPLVDVVNIIGFGPNLTISTQGSFSSGASTTTGITNTTETVTGSVSGLLVYASEVFHKALIPPNYSLYAAGKVFGLIALQADSLEELVGFL
jgi:hypothetical protein